VTTFPPQPIPAKQKSLKGFYVAMGVLLALTVGGWFAWTPLKIMYYEKKVEIASSLVLVPLKSGWSERHVKAHELAMLGPASYKSFARLLGKGSSVDRIEVMMGLSSPGNTLWALPLYADVAMSKHSDSRIPAIAAELAATMVEVDLGRPVVQWPERKKFKNDEEHRLAISNCFLDWWEREGKAMYGIGE